jgi:FKBP-type peptidyl-prolyl cis-trans isomerase FkpA
MRNKQILIAASIMIFFSASLFAQSSSWKQKKMQNIRPGTVVNLSRPTQVSGEGVLTASGVKYWDIQVGQGAAASKGHVVTLLYTAWAQNGKEFASSQADGKASTFTLGVGQVIKGWEYGVEGMKVGGKRQIRIPAELAYGKEGLPPLVPPNSPLIFDMELINLQ